MGIQEIRLKNLLDYIGDEKVSVFSKRHGLDASYISQLKNGTRSFGEKAARKMEAQIGLAPYSLDIDVNSILSNESEQEIILAVKSALPWMSQSAKKDLIRTISDHL